MPVVTGFYEYNRRCETGNNPSVKAFVEEHVSCYNLWAGNDPRVLTQERESRTTTHLKQNATPVEWLATVGIVPVFWSVPITLGTFCPHPDSTRVLPLTWTWKLKWRLSNESHLILTVLLTGLKLPIN